MKGGKLLSEGGFGCVFNPSMKCDGTSDLTTRNILIKI